MTIKEQIVMGVMIAMKGRDKVRLNALRNINSAFLEYEKEKAGNVVTDDIAFTILSKLEKRTKESISLYRDGKRDDLADEEQAELEVIQSMLPRKLSDEELEKEISSLILTNGFSGRKNLGQIMKIMMGDFAGRIDGNSVRKIAENLLG